MLPLEIIRKVAQAGIFSDSKTFVDRPIRTDLNSATSALRDAASKEELKRAIETHFAAAGDDLSPFTPSDWAAETHAFDHIPCMASKDLACSIHKLWPALWKEIRPEGSSLLRVPRPIVIAGERFREMYYWDTYWVIKGLVASRMPAAARDLLINFCSLIEDHGFIPNGIRAYYLSRSQPPLLAAMVALLRDTDAWDAELHQMSLSALRAEHRYWMHGPKAVRVQGRDGQVHVLNRYYAQWTSPRPESFKEDDVLASHLDHDSEKQALMRNIATAAESGWDFSSRWCSDPCDLRTIRTTQIVPVDLNTYLWQLETTLAHLCAHDAVDGESMEWATHAERRRDAMFETMWDEQACAWHDLLMEGPLDASYEAGDAAVAGPALRVSQLPALHAASWMPFLQGMTSSGDCQGADFSCDMSSDRIVRSMRNSGLVQPGGLLTTLVESGQQWDSPNCWPPLVCTWVEGLIKYGGSSGTELGQQLGCTFVKAVADAFTTTGFVWEKFDALCFGRHGRGGEYDAQVGFGWTNGTALHFLSKLDIRI